MMIRFQPKLRALLAGLAEEGSRSMAAETEWPIRQEAKRRSR